MADIEEEVNLYEILTYRGEEYQRVMLGMLDDDFYILQDRLYDFVHWVRNPSEEIIGFGAGTYCGDGVLLELFYLLPEYRGGDYFKNYLDYYMSNYTSVILDRPNQYSILSLIRNGFAEMKSDWLVHTFPLLSFVEYDTVEGDVRRCSHYYDLRLSATVDPINKVISPLQEVDIQCFNASHRRDEFYTEDYWQKIITSL